MFIGSWNLKRDVLATPSAALSLKNHQPQNVLLWHPSQACIALLARSDYVSAPCDLALLGAVQIFMVIGLQHATSHLNANPVHKL
jgi:hypothetical protein